jgi:Tol biopolymer transport system component
MRRICAVIGCLLTFGAVADAAAGAAASGPGPYFSATFDVHRNSHTFGQSPAWTRDGNVLSNENDKSGIEQVYVSRLDGSRAKCLTCGRLAGPNGFPEQRPEGDWILFCSVGAQPEHYGAPCLGGYGTDLYVMRPNGSEVTRLTGVSDPNAGKRYDHAGGVPYDNYHAYWSPDGRHLVWTRTEAYPLSAGGQRWEMLIADFVTPEHGRPRLKHVRVVGPAYGVYETQAWAPDGSGFLFTAFGPRNSPYQADPPGWMHLQLYYMRLYGRGASPRRPLVTHLTNNNPAYEEQATFTPDMRDVIVMTSRATPATWYQTVITAAQWTGFDAPDAGSVGTPMFVADFTDPRFTADLWMIDVATGATRQLTNFRRVIPEFGWNFDYTRLLWSGNARRDSHITWVASFRGITPSERRRPRTPAAGLFGRPIVMSRVRGSVQPMRDASIRPLGAAALAIPLVRKAGGDRQTLPGVVVSYVALLGQQLRDLAGRAAMGIEQPPL